VLSAFEKERLAVRKEGFQRWLDPGVVVEAAPGSLGYVSLHMSLLPYCLRLSIDHRQAFAER